MRFLTKMVCALLLVVATITTSSVDAVTAPVVTPTVAAVPPKPLSIQSSSSLDEKIDIVATKYGVQPSLMRSVIKCESSYRTDAIGDGGTSFGLVQINLPSHPTITKAQAFDADFALDFLASNLAKGKGDMWTCYRMITSQ